MQMLKKIIPESYQNEKKIETEHTQHQKYAFELDYFWRFETCNAIISNFLQNNAKWKMLSKFAGEKRMHI